ncbi:MAG: HAD hydrolase-like protein [Methanobacteriota archaeon]
MKVLAVLDADDTMWDVAAPIWDRAVREARGDLLVLSDGAELRLRPEVRPGLMALKARGILLAVASHNLDLPEAGVKGALKALGIDDLFDFVMVRNSSDKNAMIGDICAKLDVDMVEDRVFFTDDSGRHVENARRIGADAQIAGASIQSFFDAVLEAASR